MSYELTVLYFFRVEKAHIVMLKGDLQDSNRNIDEQGGSHFKPV